MAGMFSDTLDWLDNSFDTELPAMPMQLAARGHDVWISSGRGRLFSDKHTTYVKDDPLTAAAFWDFSYEEVGMDDVSTFVDAIVAARPGACSKVTVVPHSTAVNSVLVAAASMPNLREKVGSIVAVAPCLQVSLSDFWLDTQDITSTNTLYDLLSALPSLFGPNYYENIEPFCTESPINTMICDKYLRPNPAESDPHLKETSLKAFEHVHQNTIQGAF